MARTTLILENNLINKIKKLALKRNKTLKDTITELLIKGLGLQKTKEKKIKFKLNTFKSSSTVDINDRNALYTKMGERP